MISLRGITKAYATPAGAYPALRGVDLEIGAGELVAVVGKSGSGKSPLLHLIGGVDRPSAGTITVGGTPLHELGEELLAVWRGEKIGFVFQFFQLLPTLTAAENVMLPMDFRRKLPPRQRRPRALELLDLVGVVNQANKFPFTLSGGELQRVAIARALANEPNVILADEPTGNLDSENARAILDLFRAMVHRGTTVVIATHEADIARVIDRRIRLADGLLVGGEASAVALPQEKLG